MASDLLPLREILARVSRSFYLSLRVLPPETRETVALAYLLARAADTVADTRIVSAERRLGLLGELRATFQGERSATERLAVLADLGSLTQTDDVIPEERALLAELPHCMRLLDRLPPFELRLVREVLDTLTSGMHDDLSRFPGERSEDLRALETRGELLHYCYQVAGCVGAFWSELHANRLRTLTWVDLPEWSAKGVRLGRALQLCNVLRDIQRDLSHGRCYLPSDELATAGLAPGDLLSGLAWGRLRPLYEDLVAQAVADAHAGMQHLLRIPPRDVGLRMAELLPLLLALRTLGVVLKHNPLAANSPRKVPRRVVYGLVARGYLASRDNRRVIALYRATLRESGLTRLARTTLASPA